jgi:hypothetical protein
VLCCVVLSIQRAVWPFTIRENLPECLQLIVSEKLASRRDCAHPCGPLMAKKKNQNNRELNNAEGSLISEPQHFAAANPEAFIMYAIAVSDSPNLPPVLSGPHLGHLIDAPIPEGYEHQMSYDSLAEAVEEFLWFAGRAG